MILITVTVTLQSLFRFDRGLRDELAIAGQQFQLAKQLRADIHRAESATLLPNESAATSLRLETLGGRVEYDGERGRLIRHVYRADERIHQEVFYLAAKTEYAFRKLSDSPPRIRLELRTQTGRIPQAADAVDLNFIDGTLALHRRLDR